MVRIKATEELKEFLWQKGVSKADVYRYAEIRKYLLEGDPGILSGCEFDWPKVKEVKCSPIIEKIRERRKVREYQEMVSNIQIKTQEPLKELKHGMGMGLSLISVLFVGMLSGYYLGKYFFEFSELGSLIVSFIVMVIGIYLEVAMFLMRSDDIKQKKE